MATPYHAKFLALHLTRRAEFGSHEVFSHALSDAQVDLNPHQIDAALFAARSPISKGAILADEVGLGKTIEAALLLAQRWAERRRKLLVIVPASIAAQLSTKSKSLYGRAIKLLDEESMKLEAWEQDQRAQFHSHYKNLEDKLRALVRKFSTSLDLAEEFSMQDEKIRIQGAMDREDARFREQCRILQDKKFTLLEQKRQKLKHDQIIEPQFVIRWHLER